MKSNDFDLDNILIYEKSNENILVHNISYKKLIAAKPLSISFDKIDGFIRVYKGTRCLVLFVSKKYDFIYNGIKDPVGLKNGITYVFSHNYAKIKVDSYDSLPIEKAFTFIILSRSVWNKDQNHFY